MWRGRPRPGKAEVKKETGGVQDTMERGRYVEHPAEVGTLAAIGLLPGQEVTASSDWLVIRAEIIKIPLNKVLHVEQGDLRCFSYVSIFDFDPLALCQ